MKEYEEDESWRSDSLRNENRYQEIIDRSVFPAVALLRESFKEDRTILFPRMLLQTFWTARRIPVSFFLRGEARETFAVETMKLWSRRMAKMAKVKLSIRGLELIPPGSNYLFACNHSATMDSVLAYMALPLPAAFVVNQELTNVPVIKYWLETSRCVLVHQGSEEGETRAFREMIGRLRGKRSLLIFPEGYIHQGSGLGEFKRGGLYSALISEVPIVPMCVYGAREVMPAGSLHVHAGRSVRIAFGEPIKTASLQRNEKKSLEALVRSRMLDLKLSLAAEWVRQS